MGPIPRFRWSGTTARTLGATLVGVTAALLAPGAPGWHLRGLIGWDAGAALLLATHWLRIFQATPLSTRTFAAADDPGRGQGWVLGICASAFSLGNAVVALHHTSSMPRSEVALWTALAVAGIVLAWLLTHTLYTLRYAYLFYGRPSPRGGIAFPGTTEPCDLDFAYFAFTIGMTFQTSDVGMETTEIRTTALGQELLAFVFNTTILAMTLNLLIEFFSR